ncbi:hypothetical protein C0V75_10085 [Tabrizicola sp. TH137]|uniref:glycosyltransferase family 4 protein n=1 Tax=Tabrizicola sp. TH137 TaxID=2067452 RepID=UPI000C7D02B9|nr:glycosyltransferase family 4 protein [Tabrizicola sp. TH137]PLL12306.1 hypothetical protein C0V75_10085 [Tabrizicola sp. TH137]
MDDVIVVPDSAGADLRRHLGLAPSAPLRISYIPGPGDVVGTFDQWREGRHETRVPIIAYSLMFYELMHRLEADCQIISLAPPPAPRSPRQDGRFRFDQVQERAATNRWQWIWSQHRFARDVTAQVARFRPHIVLNSTHTPAAAWKGMARGRKLILSAHNSFWPMGRPPADPKNRLRRALLAGQAAALDGAVCTSHECMRQIAALTGGRVKGEVEHPQIVDRYPLQRRDRPSNLLFLGRTEPSKGVFLLLDAFERLAGKHPDLTLTFAGSGSSEAALRARCAASPHAGRITFLGRIGSARVHAAIAASDLVICPTMTSFNEGLAVVGFEAAAHGIPSVLSSVVPAAELLGDAASVFTADDGQALEGLLLHLLNDPDTYRRKCAATALVRERLYDRSLSWGSALFRSLMSL